jgi:hypothetical protein
MNYVNIRFPWQWGGEIWTSIVYTIVTLNFFLDIFANLYIFSNLKTLCGSPAQYSGQKMWIFTQKKNTSPQCVHIAELKKFLFQKCEK